MDEKLLKFQVGIVVLAALAAALILIMLLGAWPTIFESYYTVYADFPEAPGVARDTPVLKSGIKIGHVRAVELLESGNVRLTLEIESEYRVRKSERCRISRGSLITGDAVLEFYTPPDKPPSKEFLADRDSIKGVVAGDPFEVFTNLEDEMGSAFASMQRAGDEVSELAASLQDLVGENGEQLKRIIDKTEVALDQIHRTAVSVNDLVGDPELNARLKGTLEKIPGLFEDVQQTLSETRETLAAFRETSVRAQRNLANMENFTAPLAERGEELAEDLAGSVRNVNQLLSELVQFSRSLNSPEGTIGALTRDRELYEKLQDVIRNVETATRKIQPILDDVRVLTDKLARDPRLLGVKGALDRRPSGAGTKWPVYSP